MLYKIVKPKNTVNLVAGLVGMTYERAMASLQQPVIEADDLTLIDGIGPTFASRLNEGGVYTFEKLAQMSPEQIRSTARLKSWQGEPDAWIAEARERLAGD